MPIRPPGRHTRSSSPAATSKSGATMASSVDSTTSKAPSGKGRSSASPSRNVTSSPSAWARRPACSSSSGSSATPTTLQKRRAAAKAALPLPQATSSTRSPACRSADSHSSSLVSRVREPVTAAAPDTQAACCSFLTVAVLRCTELLLVIVCRKGGCKQWGVTWLCRQRPPAATGRLCGDQVCDGLLLVLVGDRAGSAMPLHGEGRGGEAWLAAAAAPCPVGRRPVQPVPGVDAVAAGDERQGHQADEEDQQRLHPGCSLGGSHCDRLQRLRGHS